VALAAFAHLPGVRARRLLRRFAQTVHATAHSHSSGHPIIRSIEPREEWSWCYIDEVMMNIPEVHGETRIPRHLWVGEAGALITVCPV